jgi:hypothetical protein
VLESQLLATLANSLDLVWQREDPTTRPAPLALPARQIDTALPVDVAGELRQLARLGHASGLHRRLTELAADPVWADECAVLQQHLATFNFQAIISRMPVEGEAQ